MKFIRLLILFLLLFIPFIEIFTPTINVSAQTKRKVIADHQELKLSYDFEKQKDKSRLRIYINQKGGAAEKNARFKIQFKADHSMAPESITVEKMNKVGEWFVEETFSQTSQRSFLVIFPVEVTHLQLQLQKDEKNDRSFSTTNVRIESTKASMGRADEVIKNRLPSELTGPYELSFDPLPEKTIATADSVYDEVSDQRFRPSVRNTITNSYVNLAPSYSESNGIIPDHSWQPIGQTNVMNYQGGDSTDRSSHWDKQADWDVSNDQHNLIKNGYIRYGKYSSDPEIALRKYAQQTSTKNQFKVRLNVKGKKSFDPGVDIVIAIDNSGSMNNYGTSSVLRKARASSALKLLINELKKVQDPSQKNLRVGALSFSDYSGGLDNDETPLSNNPNDWTKFADNYANSMSIGRTFTQRALIEARDIFNDSPAKPGEVRKKMMFVLTDGAPNKSWTPTLVQPDTSIYYDSLYVGKSTSGAPNYLGGTDLGGGDLTKITPKGFQVGAYTIKSHLTTTNSIAKDIKNEGIEIHTMAVGITAPTNKSEHSRTELIEGIRRMASKKVRATSGEEEYFFNDVSDNDDLSSVIQEWYLSVIEAVSNGELIDPLGDKVELVGTPSIKQVSNGAPTISKMPSRDTSSSTIIKYTGIHLSQGQEIEIDYTIKLKNGYEGGKWYQANKRTTLTPTPGVTNDVLDFGVPSIRGEVESFSVPVEKKWIDTFKNKANYWELRPSEVRAVLQKKHSSATSWTIVDTLSLSPPNNWKNTFTNVKNETDAIYRVIEDPVVRGYKTSYNLTSFTKEVLGTQTVTMTNTLKTTDIKFNKVMQDGETPFPIGEDRPAFTLTSKKSGDTIYADREPDSEGQVNYTDLPVGSYFVTESHVPKGYVKSPDFEITIEENGAENLVAQLNGSTNPFVVINRLKSYSLDVEKIDTEGESLLGASFELSGPDGYLKKIDSEVIFSFADLKPGEYHLKETKAPSGYSRLKETIVIMISIDGKITVSENERVTSNIDLANNKISLRVRNDMMGQLPSTGGAGTKRLALIAFVLMGGATLIAGLYIIISNRKKYN